MARLKLEWEDDSGREIEIPCFGIVVRLKPNEIKTLVVSGFGTWHIQREETLTPGDGDV